MHHPSEQQMLGTGYAHRMLSIDILRGDLGTGVQLTRWGIEAYRGGHQFAELDLRARTQVPAKDTTVTNPVGKPLCECWEWQESKGHVGQWVRVNEGYPNCGHEFDFGRTIARVNITRSIRIDPRPTIPYLDRYRYDPALLGLMVARMRGYGHGYHDGYWNRPPTYHQYEESPFSPEYQSEYRSGFGHGMEYNRSMQNNNTEVGEYSG